MIETYVEVTKVRAVVDSIHLNPVRPGLVERPGDREWSSARWYAGSRPILVEIEPTMPRIYEL